MNKERVILFQSILSRSFEVKDKNTIQTSPSWKITSQNDNNIGGEQDGIKNKH